MPAKAKKDIQAATESEVTEKMACESIPAAPARKKKNCTETGGKGYRFCSGKFVSDGSFCCID